MSDQSGDRGDIENIPCTFIPRLLSLQNDAGMHIFSPLRKVTRVMKKFRTDLAHRRYRTGSTFLDYLSVHEDSLEPESPNSLLAIWHPSRTSSIERYIRLLPLLQLKAVLHHFLPIHLLADSISHVRLNGRCREWKEGKDHRWDCHSQVSHGNINCLRSI